MKRSQLGDTGGMDFCFLLTVMSLLPCFILPCKIKLLVRVFEFFTTRHQEAGFSKNYNLSLLFSFLAVVTYSSAVIVPVSRSWRAAVLLGTAPSTMWLKLARTSEAGGNGSASHIRIRSTLTDELMWGEESQGQVGWHHLILTRTSKDV